MTIRMRYHLALLPLFLGLASAGIGLHFIVQSREIAWGIAEQAKDRALCLKAFSVGGTMADTTGAATPSGNMLARFAEASGGLAIRSFTRDGTGWKTVTLFNSSGITLPPAPDDGILDALRRGEPAAAVHAYRPDSTSDECTGYVAVESADGIPSRVIAVTAAETITREERRNFMQISALFAIAVMGAGFFVAEFLVRRVRGDIAALTSGADALTAGDYSHVWRSSSIRELDDLGNSLGSIGAILQDGMRRTRQRFLRPEQMPGDEEIASAYQNRCTATSAPGPDGCPDCAIRNIGRADLETFRGVRRTDTDWHVVVGCLKKPEAAVPPLQRIVRAQAARDHILGQLCGSPTTDPWIESDSLFGMECGEAVSIRHADRLSTFRSFGKGAVPPKPAIAAPSAIGTLSPESLAFVREYLRQFPQQPLEALADEAAALLGDRDSGVLIVYHPIPRQS